MEIKLEEKTVRDVCSNYIDSAENGVTGYYGKLNIRPAFQREFVYDDRRRNAVIDTIRKGFPLNVMYWVETDDGNYELLDGQQRTVSICKYVDNVFSVSVEGSPHTFDGLTESEKYQILNYKLMIYICKGTDREKLDWFKIINIAGVQLTTQELRNAIYTGPWLSDAKRYFSRTNSPAYGFAGKYLIGEANRQAYLETALDWVSNLESKSIEDYMNEHQHDSNASPLWIYFQSVINWVTTIFPVYRKEMKGIEWGLLYNKFNSKPLDPASLELNIKLLIQDDDVTSIRGIYHYLLSGEEKHLNLRKFSDNQKRKAYEQQKGICPHCIRDNFQQTHHAIEDMEGDHLIPWSDGGKTSDDNCQMLCIYHNRIKSNH